MHLSPAKLLSSDIVDFGTHLNCRTKGMPVIRQDDCFIVIMIMQICWLLILAMPIACIAWTITHEEVFREPRDYCARRCQTGKTLFERKFFYLFTCEYCFSHYITLLAIIFTGYKLLLDDWRGYVIAGFALVWVANVYMSLFGLIRLGMKKDRTEIKKMEEE